MFFYFFEIVITLQATFAVVKGMREIFLGVVGGLNFLQSNKASSSFHWLRHKVNSFQALWLLACIHP